jgi:RNA polymerase sigma factor (TIGR02999 family)
LTEHITELLTAWREGNRAAEAELMRLVYPVLRDLARARVGKMPSGFTLRATELVNEAYTRLAGSNIDWRNRAHFFAVAARAIRNIVVDYVRAQGAEKRGGDLPFVSLELAAEASDVDGVDLRVDWLSVHAALLELETMDADVARVVELKFFSGLTTDEIAAATSTSRATVVRDWRFARAWLADRLGAHAHFAQSSS